MPVCPNAACSKEMGLDGDAHDSGTNATSGLLSLRCRNCGHQGMVASEGLHLVFRAGRHFCFTYGTIPAQITVMVDAKVSSSYKWLGLTEEMLARHAAEWMLLRGKKTGAIVLSADQPGTLQFDHYFQTHLLFPASLM
jgi:hypothetical protein